MIETAFTATMEALPDKIALAIRDAVADLAAKTDLVALADRVAALEGAHNARSGAEKVRAGTAGQIHEYVRALIPVVWPVAIMGAAYIFKAA